MKAEAESYPKWLKMASDKEDIVTSNLGKPSSRQDAVLLAKWFKDIMEMIELDSQVQRANSNQQGKLFPNQKTSETDYI